MSYIVTMMDNKQIIVPEHVGIEILKAQVDRVNWNNTMINLKSVSRIEPMEETQYKQLPETTPQSYTKERQIRAIESMIKGFKSVNSGKLGNSKVILDKMESSLRLAKDGKTKEIIPSKMFGY